MKQVVDYRRNENRWGGMLGVERPKKVMESDNGIFEELGKGLIKMESSKKKLLGNPYFLIQVEKSCKRA